MPLSSAAQVRQDQSLDTARDGLLKIVEAIAATPPTAEELEQARNLLSQIELDSTRRIASASS